MPFQLGSNGTVEVVVGVVYDPTRDELFTAEAGHGAHLNGRSISRLEHNRNWRCPYGHWICV